MDNITSFIVGATERSLKVDQAQKDLDAAKAAVEAARAAVEAAKIEVEAAKAVLSVAKEAYEQFSDQSDAFNLPRGKFKDAVERMKGILADIGAVDGSSASAPSVEPGEPKVKAPRKRKAEVEPTEEASASEPAQSTDSVEQSAQDANDAASPEAVAEVDPSPVEEPGEFIELRFAAPVERHRVTVAEEAPVASVEALVEPAVEEGNAEGEVATDANEWGQADIDAIPSEEPSATLIAEIDNGPVVEDLGYMIDDNAHGPSELREILHAALKASAWYHTVVEPKPMTVVPSPITVEAVWAAVEGEYVPQDVVASAKNALVHGEEAAVRAIEWFAKLTALLEEGRDAEIEPFVLKASAAEAVVEKPAIEPAAAEQAADEVEIAAPDTQAPALETIEEMALFEDSEPTAEVPDVEIPPAPVPHTAPEPEAKPAAPAAPIKTGRPSWMNNK